MLQQLQTELDATYPGQVQLLAVNEAGRESGMAAMAALGDLPILQDTPVVDAWNLWSVTYRDVVLLDQDNHFVGVYNLTTNNLSDPANYAALEAMIVSEL